jgi:hypothetical protein
MTGPEHFRMAEGCLAEAERAVTNASPGTYAEAVEASAHLIAKAHVHATLALAAAVGKSTDAVEVGREIAHQLNRTAATGRKGARS